MVAHDLISAAIALPQKNRQQLMSAAALIKRRDQRLHDRCDAVECVCVTPGLKLVSHRRVPVAVIGRFVFIEGVMNAQANLFQMFLEFQVGRRVVDGICAKHDQHIDGAGVDVRAEVSQ